MNIPYQYEVVGVDGPARCMEIRYTSEGRDPVHVGARLPYVGETLEQVAAMYAPLGLWVDAERPVVVPTAGATGGYAPAPAATMNLQAAKDVKKEAVAAWRYANEIAGISVGGAKVRTDRESQAQLTGALISLQNGIIQSVDWKDADGQFVQLDTAAVTGIATVVAQHVQSCFTQEKQLCAQIDACATIEEVTAIVIPAPGYNIPVVVL
jgi:hypothetical protein